MIALGKTVEVIERGLVTAIERVLVIVRGVG